MPQTIREGSTGPDVVQWQQAIGVSPADGVFGQLTTSLTKQWQTANALVPDGVVGPQTWGMIGVTGTGTRVSITPAPKPVTKLALPTAGAGKVTSLTTANWLGVPRSVWMLGAVGGLFVGFHFHSKKLAR